MDQLEKSLEGAFKSAPKLPANGKKMIVEWLPWINLILGILTLWSAYAIYHWAHLANSLINYANSLSQAYSGTNVIASRWSVGIYLSLIVLVVEAALYIMAFPGLKDRKKAGWNFLFYAALVNIVYGVVILFSNYGGAGNFIGSVIGSVIGLYFLFQVRDAYTGKKAVDTPKPTPAA